MARGQLGIYFISFRLHLLYPGMSTRPGNEMLQDTLIAALVLLREGINAARGNRDRHVTIREVVLCQNWQVITMFISLVGYAECPCRGEERSIN